MKLFDHPGDYRAFLRCLAEAHARVPVEVFAYCIMPNHFHLIVRPSEDSHLSDFMRLATMTHSKRWQAARGTVGLGGVYQGPYRRLPIQTERYFFSACRYVEANPLRARLVGRAEDWEWSSLAARGNNFSILKLADWPILQPEPWQQIVNAAVARPDLDQMRSCIRRSVPYGDSDWAIATAAALNLTAGFRRPGRPKTTPGVVS
jgi:putative transposase